MVSTTHTGGLKKFVYNKENTPELTYPEMVAMDQAYERVRIRKEKERKQRIKFYLVLGIILLGLGIYFFLIKP